MTTTQHRPDATTAPDDTSPTRYSLTHHRIPPRDTTRNLWHTDASSMQDTAPAVASTRWELPC